VLRLVVGAEIYATNNLAMHDFLKISRLWQRIPPIFVDFTGVCSLIKGVGIYLLVFVLLYVR